MAELSDAFVALPAASAPSKSCAKPLPGLSSVSTAKRCGVLNVGGYYDPLLALFDGAVRAGFIRESGREIVFATADPAQRSTAGGSDSRA